MLIDNIILVELDSMNETHERELEILNELHNLVVVGDNVKAIDNKLSEFIEDVKAHFKKEEDNMFKYKFPPFMKHKMIHHKIITELSKLLKIWNENNDARDIKKYLEEEFKPWLINHLQTMDKVTAKFLNEAGAE